MAHSPSKPFTLAVAVFVKTPGRSPLKTRLAKTVGRDNAHKFYLLACKAIAQTLRQAQRASAGGIQPFWAVAEDDADDVWTDFPIIHQGPGELGDKLHLVYASLLKRFDSVALIGADAPQISAKDLRLTREALIHGKDFVAGPASDGGFYLFAGKKSIEEGIWLKTPYSQSDTLEKLLDAIGQTGSISTLHLYTDVDTWDDLKKFIDEVDYSAPLSEDQKALISHCNDMIGKV